jgi:acetylornithine deacetylase
MKDAQSQLASTLTSLSDSDDWFRTHPCQIEYFGAWWQPGLVNPTHPLVESLKSHYKTVYTGKEAKVEASPWATDGGRLTHLADTPSIVFGPGVTSMAHFPDEYVVVDDVLKCAEIIAHTIVDWCGAVKE